MTFLPPMPGYPGPAFSGRRSQIAPVSLPMFPVQPTGLDGGAPAQRPAPSPFEGLARAGVPISLTPDGRPVLQAGGGPAQGMFGPPQGIPGMPEMPQPPSWMIDGDPNSGGLFRPLEPVAPFDLSSRVRR